MKGTRARGVALDNIPLIVVVVGVVGCVGGVLGVAIADAAVVIGARCCSCSCSCVSNRVSVSD